MPAIPGLSLGGQHSKESIFLPTFTGYINFPGSLRNGTLQRQQDFKKVEDIYKGKFGKYYKCYHLKSLETYTLKKYNASTEIKDGFPADFLREINILNVMNHDHIVNCHAVVVGNKLELNHLLLDYCVASLENLMQKNVEEIYEKEMIRCCMMQMFDAINFVHDCFIVHRNITSNSILFTENLTLKIGGFRNASFYCKDESTPFETEIIYKAPELLLGETDFEFSADMWAVGCIFANLLLRKPLFSGDDKFEVFNSMVDQLGSPSEYLWPGFEKYLMKGSFYVDMVSLDCPTADLKNTCKDVPEDSYSLLSDILIYYPKARLTASEALKNAYFKPSAREYPPNEKASILRKIQSR